MEDIEAFLSIFREVLVVVYKVFRQSSIVKIVSTQNLLL